jgi:outer membrane protein TolC
MFVFYKKTISLLVCLYMIVPAARLSAQTKSSYALSDLIDSAQHYLPYLLREKALVSAAKAGITDTRHTFLPKSILADEISLGTDNSLPGTYLSYGIIPSASSGLRNSNDYQAASGNIAIFHNEYELLNFGLSKALVKRAESNAELSQADLDREIFLLKWQVGKLFFEILKNQNQLAIDRQNVLRNENIYKVIQAITQSGIRPGADSSLAMAELSKTRIGYNQTLGQFNRLKLEMSYLTGISSSRIQIDSLEKQNGPTLSSLANNPEDSMTNPLIGYFVKQRSLYLSTEELVKKSYLPKILLTGTAWGRGSSIDYNANYKTLGSGLGYQRFNYMAGVTFVYDLFNGVHKRDKLAISRNNTLASEYELQQQELSLNNEDRQADEAIRTAERNLEEVPVQIKAAQDTYDQKTAQYKAGIINLIDLTNASFVLYRSQSDYVQTLSDWFRANLDKAAATGNLDPFIQSVKN